MKAIELCKKATNFVDRLEETQFTMSKANINVLVSVGYVFLTKKDATMLKAWYKKQGFGGFSESFPKEIGKKKFPAEIGTFFYIHTFFTTCETLNIEFEEIN